DPVSELRREIDAAVGVGREILDRLAHDLVVADEGPHVVRGVDRGGEHPDLLHGADDSAGANEITRPERTEDDQEDAGGEVAEQAAPGDADRHAGGGNERREGRRLDAEQPEDRDEQDDVESNRHGRGDVEAEGRVDTLADEPAADDPPAVADERAADDPERDGADDADPESHPYVDGNLQHVLELHARPPRSRRGAMAVAERIAVRRCRPRAEPSAASLSRCISRRDGVPGQVDQGPTRSAVASDIRLRSHCWLVPPARMLWAHTGALTKPAWGHDRPQGRTGATRPA